MKKYIYFSSFDDIYINMAIENYFFSPGSSEYLLMIYTDKNSVVIGKHQNPFYEVNLEYIKKNGINLSRRESGGGTVFHDMGNLNFSFITDNKYDIYKESDLFIKKLFFILGLKYFQNSKKSIFINNKKISGSAFRISKYKKMRHFTLLVDSDLDIMKKSLEKNYDYIISEDNSVRSEKSEVANISSYLGKITVKDLIKIISGNFTEYINTETPEETFYYERKKYYLSKEWIYGYTNNFRVKIDNNDFYVENGKIYGNTYFDDYLKGRENNAKV